MVLCACTGKEFVLIKLIKFSPHFICGGQALVNPTQIVHQHLEAFFIQGFPFMPFPPPPIKKERKKKPTKEPLFQFPIRTQKKSSIQEDMVFFFNHVSHQRLAISAVIHSRFFCTSDHPRLCQSPTSKKYFLRHGHVAFPHCPSWFYVLGCSFVLFSWVFPVPAVS